MAGERLALEHNPWTQALDAIQCLYWRSYKTSVCDTIPPMPEDKTLTPAQAQQFYDRMGARQDWNRFYEQAAIDRMIEQGDFANAHRVVEFGCGTGRIAERLLARHLPSDATYVGLDLSATMVNLATERVAPFGRRAQIVRTEGAMILDAPSESADRFFTNYVFDLLSREDIAALV